MFDGQVIVGAEPAYTAVSVTTHCTQLLAASQALKNQGLDVVAGYVEPHERPETRQLQEGLEALPVAFGNPASKKARRSTPGISLSRA